MKADPVSPSIDKQSPGSSHRVLADWLLQLPTGTRVLDIGAATGTLGRLCTGRGLDMTGLEPQGDWAELARPFYSSFISNTIELALQNDPQALSGYDVLVFADVLEHLVDPLGILRKLSALQPESCIYMISLPNVANLWVRIGLLFGRFDYQERGILDRTHLHFYTQRSMLAFLSQAGLQPRQVKVTSIPLELVHPFFQTRAGGLAIKALHGLTLIFPRLLGYQFVVKAEKNSAFSAPLQ